nr:hypothetical protein CFP56_57553 [Quercus suber]
MASLESARGIRTLAVKLHLLTDSINVKFLLSLKRYCISSRNQQCITTSHRTEGVEVKVRAWPLCLSAMRISVVPLDGMSHLNRVFVKSSTTGHSYACHLLGQLSHRHLFHDAISFLMFVRRRTLARLNGQVQEDRTQEYRSSRMAEL